ncbi:MAG: multidrug ABC transporter substrate-binding protein [Rhodospirillales bacterium 20-60-12]|nr:MAG: multidrug ABC transporter substrate-binding protein [Rhodospirillales bacterium 20-60-12]
MFGSFERRVAARYLRARRGERFVSVIAIFSLIGIALGVATLIIVMSVMNGFRDELLAQILGLNGDIGVFAAGPPLTNYDDLAAKFRAIPGVISATPIVQGEVLMSGPQGGAIGGVARGISAQGLATLHTVSGHIIAGSLSDLTGEGTIAVGEGVASQLGITLGGNISLILPQGSVTVIGTIPRIESFRVVAIFNTGNVKNPDNDHAQRSAIQNELAGIPANIQDWQENNNSFFAAVNVERNVMFLILTLIILVAAFNVISSLIMMVKDKTRDIAILRTMGASSGAILRIFLMCGASVGVLGTFIGFVLGAAFSANIEAIRQFIQGLTGTQLFNPTVYYLEQLPARLVWNQVIEVIVMALILSLLATLYPSWRAARTDPVEALRHD